MAKIDIELGDYVNAPDGSLLIKKNGHWIATSFAELNKVNDLKFKELEELKSNYLGLSNYSRRFVEYAKSHFLVVFNYFKIKILSGEIDCTDESILKLDEAVLKGEISVKEAIEKHEFLKEVFSKLYLGSKETKQYPEV